MNLPRDGTKPLAKVIALKVIFQGRKGLKSNINKDPICLQIYYVRGSSCGRLNQSH